MDLSNLSQKQIESLKEMAAKMNTTIEKLLESNKDVNHLLESFKDKVFGVLND